VNVFLGWVRSAGKVAGCTNFNWVYVISPIRGRFRITPLSVLLPVSDSKLPGSETIRLIEKVPVSVDSRTSVPAT
jgi:hypothetical protein